VEIHVWDSRAGDYYSQAKVEGNGVYLWLTNYGQWSWKGDVRGNDVYIWSQSSTSWERRAEIRGNGVYINLVKKAEIRDKGIYVWDGLGWTKRAEAKYGSDARLIAGATATLILFGKL
jgi:hypothetical protein